MKNTINNIEYASLLYDFYGDLLDEGKKEIMSLYHEENYSLSEIASEFGQTRQAVHYNLKKAETELKRYDDCLGLIDEYLDNIDKAKVIKEEINKVIAGEHLSDESNEKLDNIVKLIDDMVG